MGPNNRWLKILSLVVAFALTVSSVAAAQYGSNEPGVASFLSAVNSISDEIKELNAQKNITVNDIHLVSVAKMSNSGNSATLSKAIAKNAPQIATLRNALGANTTIAAKLAAAGVSVDQVVAMDVETGAQIHIFYQ